MSTSSHRLMLAAVLVFWIGTATAQTKPYPKPYVTSATGQMVADFTLKDENGKDFRLSDLRGNWVLLFFYRGYW